MMRKAQAEKQTSPEKEERTNNSAQDEKDIRDARRALKESRKKGRLSWEQVKRDVGI